VTVTVGKLCVCVLKMWDWLFWSSGCEDCWLLEFYAV